VCVCVCVCVWCSDAKRVSSEFLFFPQLLCDRDAEINGNDDGGGDDDDDNSLSGIRINYDSGKCPKLFSTRPHRRLDTHPP